MEWLCLGAIGLIVAPWKFDVLKTSIFALEASLLGQIKFPQGNYHYIFSDSFFHDLDLFSLNTDSNINPDFKLPDA